MKEIKEFLNYTPTTGLFQWIKSPGNRVRTGHVVTCLDSHGYVIVQYDHVLHRAHRLAWWFVYDEWPEDQIDHINRIRTDNRIDNLRKADGNQNAQNTLRFNGGCTYEKSRNKWKSQIMSGGKSKFIGRFNSKEEATQAYEKVYKELTIAK